MIRILLIFAALLLSGCVVKTAGSVAKAGVDVGVAATKTTVKAAGAAIDVATPDGDKKKDKRDADEPRPYDPARDARADVEAAIVAAHFSGRNVLLVLGGNWCHDSRGLAAKFQKPELARVIAEKYELVFIDVGYRDRNLDIPARFGVPEIYGTPTVLILSPDETLLNRDSVHDWRNAASKSYMETLAYFRRFAPENVP